ncbi:dihydropteroate synthase [Streptomyces olivaceus]
MGILNVTPDSFSDGGLHGDIDRAVAHGLALAAAGADIVDIGGESTRPGADPVTLDEELARVVPVVRELVSQNIFVSIDTMHATVASAAIEAGAGLVNDVSGGLADPDMAAVVADADVPYIAMHWRAPSRTMAHHADYEDVVTEVRGELERRVEALTVCGVRPERLLLDPGLGFAKRPEHDWALLAHLHTLTELRLPVLVGASRKSFLSAASSPVPAERDAATAAVSALALASGAWGVRVHNVRANLDAIRVAASWQANLPPGSPFSLVQGDPGCPVTAGAGN